ncbi:MAG TPA: TRAP transporter permease [Clostridia bacterium]|nr:TRAP transporter permease [Clostridia bacterium]
MSSNKGEARQYGVTGLLITVIGIGFALYHLYVTYTGSIEPLMFRSTHLGVAFVLAFLVLSERQKSRGQRMATYVMAIASAAVLFYIYVNYQRFVMHIPYLDQPKTMDILMGIVLIALILELSRRLIGWLLPAVALVFLLYSILGPYMPGALRHPGFSVSAIVDNLFMTVEGIFGLPIATSSTYIVLFVIFGSVLAATGAGEFFTDFACALAGRSRGGPAKVAVVSSALFGSINGSAAANVMATGTFTIPLMKRLGFSPTFAGAVEAAASSGGAFLPPIMGSAAFIMAEMLGIPYLAVAKASILPALLYYFGVYVAIDLEAARAGLKGMNKEDLPPWKGILLRSYYVLPLVLLIWMMLRGYSPSYAAFWAILSTIGISFVSPKRRISLAGLAKTLENGARSAIHIVAACAAAGIIVGTISLTGLGGKFSAFIISLSGGYVTLSLVFAAAIAIVLGMGMTISPTYILTAVIAAPVLVSLGVTPIAAHLFVLYFACLAPITPPVALAAYAAAGLAGSDFNRTGWTAARLGLVGFVIPFIFVFNNALMLSGNTVDVLLAIPTSLCGTAAVSVAASGWLGRSLRVWKRVMTLIGGLLLIQPGIVTDAIGIALLAIAIGHEVLNTLRGSLYRSSHQWRRDVGTL